MATTVAGPTGSHNNDWTSAETTAGRNVGLSLWRGVRGRCPRCGRGRLFCAFLKIDDHCSVCRLDFTGHRADDLPAYLVIVIVGHVLVPVILWIEVDYAPSLAFQLGVYLPITALTSIALLQPVKGAMVAQDARLRRASARRIPGLRGSCLMLQATAPARDAVISSCARKLMRARSIPAAPNSLTAASNSTSLYSAPITSRNSLTIGIL
jgi:uncharacterized protein (DUF983 family)